MRHGAFGVIKIGVGKHDPATTPPRLYAVLMGGGGMVVTESAAQHRQKRGYGVEPITATAREAGWVQRVLRPEKLDPPVTVNAGSPLWLLTCVGGRSAVVKDEAGRWCGAPRGLTRVPGTEALSSGEMTGRGAQTGSERGIPAGRVSLDGADCSRWDRRNRTGNRRSRRVRRAGISAGCWR